MRKIFITGADGFIGRTLCKQLLSETDVSIVASCIDESLYNSLLSIFPVEDRSRFSLCISSDIAAYDFSDIDTVVHLAFARIKFGNEAIARSLDYTIDFFNTLSKYSIKRIINISTQGVYGDYPDFRREDTAVSPSYPYSMAKYGAERMLDVLFDGSDSEYVSLRLDNVIQSQNLVVNLCRSAKYDGVLSLVGGKQVFSYLDVEDAANAIKTVLLYSGKCDTLYNVGFDCERYSLLDIADKVAKTAKKKGYPEPEIKFEEKDIHLWSGMDTKHFCSTFDWKPQIEIDEMIERVFDSI